MLVTIPPGPGCAKLFTLGGPEAALDTAANMYNYADS